jgi:large conductance mechanosensitive channel
MSRVTQKVAQEVARGRGLMHGFSEFVKQYGVAPLAIGVVIGTAVNDLVKTIVDGLITPFISLISPTKSLQDLTFTIGASVFKIGAVLNSLLSFMVVVLVVYMFVKLVLRNDELLEKK